MKAQIFVGVIALATALTASTANALLIDFTDTSVWGSGNQGTSLTKSYAAFGGFDVTLTSTGGSLNFTSFDGGNPADLSYCAAGGGTLACGRDGAGVGDDEISGGFVTTGQSITATFSKALTVTGFHFLDLFRSATGGDQERALIDFGSNGTNDRSIDGDIAFQSSGGYKFASDNEGNITSMTFTAGPGNDGAGSPDYALAGINVVPLPAAAWLLLGVSGALVAAKRRATARKAA